MKIQYLLALSLLTLTVSACDKKSEPAASTIPATQQAAPPAATAKTAHPKTTAVKPAAKSNAATIQPVATENSQTAHPQATVTTQTTEEALGDVGTYGREKTKTQTSKARDRAQAAEDEMMQELGKK